MWWWFRKFYPLSVQAAVFKVFVGPFLLTEFRACILHKRFNYFIGACLRFSCQISWRYPVDQLWFVFVLVSAKTTIIWFSEYLCHFLLGRKPEKICGCSSKTLHVADSFLFWKIQYWHVKFSIFWLLYFLCFSKSAGIYYITSELGNCCIVAMCTSFFYVGSRQIIQIILWPELC
jgi:hypothetical protein